MFDHKVKGFRAALQPSQKRSRLKLSPWFFHALWLSPSQVQILIEAQIMGHIDPKEWQVHAMPSRCWSIMPRTVSVFLDKILLFWPSTRKTDRAARTSRRKLMSHMLSKMPNKSSPTLKREFEKRQACTSDCTLHPNVNPANYRIEHKTVKAQTRINATEAEIESLKKTTQPSNMRIQERKQSQRNKKTHTRKHRRVKAELVHEDGASSLTRKCNDDNRRGLRNHRQEHLFAQATSKCASK